VITIRAAKNGWIVRNELAPWEWVFPTVELLLISLPAILNGYSTPGDE